MPQPHSAKFPIPKSEDEFEDIVADALRLHWGCEVHRNGRRGQRQNGVDIFGQPARLDGQYAGTQCKNTDQIDLSMVIDECKKAESFLPHIAEFVLATSASRDSEIQEEVRCHFDEHPAPFLIHLLFWEDICSIISRQHDLVRKYWSSWLIEVPPCGPYRLPSLSRREPTIDELLSSSSLFAYSEAHSKGNDASDYCDKLSESISALGDNDLGISTAIERARTNGSGQCVIDFLNQELAAWKRALDSIEKEPPPDPQLELIFLGATEDGEIDIGLRNLSDIAAIVTRISITILKDGGLIAPMLEPSAVYKIPIGELAVGESIAIDVRFVVEPHSVDRFLVDTDDLRSLLLHVTLHTNGQFSVSGDVWLWPQDED